MAEAILPYGATEESFGGLVSFVGGAVAGAIAADRVEALQGKSGRIDVNVAAVAAGDVAMGIELFANGGGAPGVGFDGAGSWRRRIRRGA